MKRIYTAPEVEVMQLVFRTFIAVDTDPEEGWDLPGEDIRSM